MTPEHSLSSVLESATLPQLMEAKAELSALAPDLANKKQSKLQIQSEVLHQVFDTTQLLVELQKQVQNPKYTMDELQGLMTKEIMRKKYALDTLFEFTEAENIRDVLGEYGAIDDPDQSAYEYLANEYADGSYDEAEDGYGVENLYETISVAMDRRIMQLGVTLPKPDTSEEFTSNPAIMDHLGQLLDHGYPHAIDWDETIHVPGKYLKAPLSKTKLSHALQTVKNLSEEKSIIIDSQNPQNWFDLVSNTISHLIQTIFTDRSVPFIKKEKAAKLLILALGKDYDLIDENWKPFE